MIPRDTALQVQAYLDGELSSAEARHIEELLEQNPGLRALSKELSHVGACLKEHELAVPVPESREFYWSKISREIQRTAPSPSAPAGPRIAWWLRFGLPLGATALLAGLLVLRSTVGGPSSQYLAIGHEIETPLTDMDSITFRSEAARMTVVWVDASLD